MLVNRLYYQFKPYLPWRLRMAARRILARRARKACRETWPINEAAARPPAGWMGWPDGKQFALVLTHDIEGPAGLARCRQLMQLEMELGFRSSFNFVPEGDYAVSSELREELKQNGFEVGVHDLHHDGSLYRTREEFANNAESINRYLEVWGASGFRSGFMLRNLDWFHDLKIQYDASTFDTDPFEPQPDGVGTIFPFWVSRRNSEVLPESGSQSSTLRSGAFDLLKKQLPAAAGYAELPYTLPQDSTLFLVLREETPEIWFRKLDWVAAQGGMALVNVHPDYLVFDESARSPREYPCRHYRELLKYVRGKYANLFWQPLPRQVARLCSAIRPERPVLRRRRICMVAYSTYQRDNRVIRYAEALAERGDDVHVVSVKSDATSPSVEKVGGVQVHRVASRFKKDQATKLAYVLPLLKFWFAAVTRVTWKHLRRRYDLIHVHNMPDFLVFAAWFPKVTGAKVILDVHDIMPEFYASKFHLKRKHFGVRVLEGIERASARFADHVIISNHLWLKPFVARSASESKCSVFINYVNRDLFYPRGHAGNGSKRIILFPGGLQWHQGLDIAIRAMPTVLRSMPEVEFHIYGDGNMKGALLELTEKLGLSESVRFFNPQPVSQIAVVMSKADLGVVPKRADSFGNEAYSTKIIEFMSLGIPLVVSSTKIDRYYFNDSVVRFFESENHEALAGAMLEVLRNGEVRQRLVANALEYADRNSWERRKGDYLHLVDSLIDRCPIRPFNTPPPGGATGSDRSVQKAKDAVVA